MQQREGRHLVLARLDPGCPGNVGGCSACDHVGQTFGTRSDFYFGLNLLSFCARKGLIFESSFPYTPESNESGQS